MQNNQVILLCFNNSLIKRTSFYFIGVLDIYLGSSTIPYEAVQCFNPCCTSHSSEIQSLHNSIINACLAACQLSMGGNMWNLNVILLSFGIKCCRITNVHILDILLTYIEEHINNIIVSVVNVKKDKDQFVTNHLANYLSQNKDNFWSTI